MSREPPNEQIGLGQRAICNRAIELLLVLAQGRGINAPRALASMVRPLADLPGQVRFITRPKSRTMRATRQLGLPPGYRRV